MGTKGLANISGKAQKASMKKLVDKQRASKKVVVDLANLDDDDDEGVVVSKPRFPGNQTPDGKQIVRTPRIAVDPKIRKKSEAMKAEGILVPAANLGVKKHTQDRRELIVAWLLNGHMYDGQLVSTTELADRLGVPMETMERDLSVIKQQFSDLYTDPERTDKELPAYAYMLLEMKMQDRGRALSLYNEIADDITAMKNAAEIIDERAGKRGLALSGRDLAAMRNAQLQALDVASKATSGLDALFKMLGGPEKVQNIIKAKSVQVNQGGQNVGNFASVSVLQDTISSMPEFRAVLPSTRSRDKTPVPAFLELNPEDEEILAIGKTARGGK